MSLNLKTTIFYYIPTDNPDGIPAVEQDFTTHDYNILLFTSEQNATRYAKLKAPYASEHVRVFSQQKIGGQVRQIGLLRVLNICKSSYPKITGVIFDHPGTINSQIYYSPLVELINILRSKSDSSGLSMKDFIEKSLSEDKDL
jgi:hypothetical protein